jgi:hypothetical protein
LSFSTHLPSQISNLRFFLPPQLPLIDPPQKIPLIVLVHPVVLFLNPKSKIQNIYLHHHPAASASTGGNDLQTWSPPRVIADETGSNQLSNHGLIQLDNGRILLGVSHYRDVRPMTGDLDLAIFDEKWLLT